MSTVRRCASARLLGALPSGLLAVAVTLLVGCAQKPPPPVGPVRLELGTTTAAGEGFLPLVGDQPLVPGSQGGFHVWLTYHLAGLDSEVVTIERTARRVRDGKLVLTTTGVVTVWPVDLEGVYTPEGPIPSFMCPTPIGVQVRDEEIEFTVRILGARDALLIEERARATPRCPPDGDPQREFCLQICSG